MGVTLKIRNLEAISEAFLLGPGVRPSVRLGLVVTGEVADYALVWEWGRVTCKPGPKTLYGLNPDGDMVVMTKTAPNGFIRVNKQKYRQIMRDELKAIPWKKIKKFSQIPPEIEKALNRAAPQCADIIAETAPYDTGALREAISTATLQSGEQVDRLSFRVRVAA